MCVQRVNRLTLDWKYIWRVFILALAFAYFWGEILSNYFFVPQNCTNEVDDMEPPLLPRNHLCINSNMLESWEKFWDVDFVSPSPPPWNIIFNIQRQVSTIYSFTKTLDCVVCELVRIFSIDIPSSPTTLTDASSAFSRLGGWACLHRIMKKLSIFPCGGCGAGGSYTI